MTYAIILIVILALVGYIVHWYNLPEVAEQRRIALEARLKARDDRRDDVTARRAAQNAAREKQRADREAARDARRKRP